MRQLPANSNNFLDWITVGIHLLIIGGLLTKFSNLGARLKRFIIGLTLLSLYFAAGTGILHYQGEGGVIPDSSNLKSGEVVTYYMDLHNGLRLPVNVDYMIPLGYSNLELLDKSQTNNNNRYALISTFAVSGEYPSLPDKLIVVYRAFGIIPMVAPFEYKWPAILIDEISRAWSGMTTRQYI